MIEVVIAFLLGLVTVPVLARIKKWYTYKQWRKKEDRDMERYEAKKKIRIQKDLDTWLNWLPYGLEEGDAEAIVDQILWTEEREMLGEIVFELWKVLEEDDLKDILCVVEFDTERRKLEFAIRADYLSYEERLKITSTIRDEAEKSAQTTHGEMGLACIGDIIFVTIGEFDGSRELS